MPSKTSASSAPAYSFAGHSFGDSGLARIRLGRQKPAKLLTDMLNDLSYVLAGQMQNELVSFFMMSHLAYSKRA